MTREEIKNTPVIVDFMLDKSVVADSRMKLRKRLEELCELAIKALEQEPCEDAISRQEVMDTIYRECSMENLGVDFAKVLLLQRKIKALQPVQPKIKTGYWYIDERPESERKVICSNCEQSIFKYHKLDFDYRPKYCPNCGFMMIESQENEDKEIKGGDKNERL